MSDTPVNAPADPAAALAAAAGVADLAAAAAVETAEGDGLLAVLLRHEIALGHQLSMQFAAAGNAALDVALAPGADEAAARPADRTAARLGGAVARVMGHVRLALLSAAALPAAAEEKWIGVCFEGEPLCSPEEADRRLAAAKAARAAARGAAVPGRAAPEARPATPAEQKQVAAGHAAAADLAAEAGVSTLALAAAEWDRVRLFLRHELAAAHRLVMRFGGRAGRLLALSRPEDERVEALRLASTAARLMARGRQALAALPRLAPGPDGGSRAPVGYYWIGERDLFARQRAEGAGQKAPDFANESRPAARNQKTEPRGQKGQKGPAGRPEPAGEASASGPDAFCHPSSDFCLLNRGRLRNGNPSGDYLAAPRCGACTRAGHACRQPAMKNGRCRFHGGKSTGPRTAAGLARSRAARRTHGGYSAEIIDLRKAAAAHARRVRALAAIRNRKTETRSQKAAPSGDRSNRAVLILPTGTFCLLSSDFWHLNPAGHRVHPLFLMASSQQRKAG